MTRCPGETVVWNNGCNQLLVCPLESAGYAKSVTLSSFVKRE